MTVGLTMSLLTTTLANFSTGVKLSRATVRIRIRRGGLIERPTELTR